MGSMLHVPWFRTLVCDFDSCSMRELYACPSLHPEHQLNLMMIQFLGITEGGLLPGIVLYLSMIYTRRE
jgi:hypothetical protein